MPSWELPMANWDDSALGFPVVTLPSSATTSPEAAVRFLLDVLVARKDMQAEHAGTAIRQIWAREQLVATAVDGGVALPHSKSGVVKQVTGVNGHSLEGMASPGAIDGKPVHRVCLILTPAS